MVTITQNYVDYYFSRSDSFFTSENGLFTQGNTNSYSEKIKYRAMYGTGIILAPLTCTIDSIAGFFFGIGAFLTGGTQRKLNEMVMKFSGSGGQVLYYVFRGCLGFVRPAYSPEELPPTITNAFCVKVDSYNSRLIESESAFNKHVLSRIIFFGAAALSVFTTITDLAIGVLAGLGALLALGTVDWLNDLAWAHLQEAISAPIYEFLIKTLNVHAKFGETQPKD